MPNTDASTSWCHERAPPGQEISQWLEKLGLGQYAQRFVENEITPSILPDLTDADLRPAS